MLTNTNIKNIKFRENDLRFFKNIVLPNINMYFKQTCYFFSAIFKVNSNEDINPLELFCINWLLNNKYNNNSYIQVNNEELSAIQKDEQFIQEEYSKLNLMSSKDVKEYHKIFILPIINYLIFNNENNSTFETRCNTINQLSTIQSSITTKRNSNKKKQTNHKKQQPVINIPPFKDPKDQIAEQLNSITYDEYCSNYCNPLQNNIPNLTAIQADINKFILLWNNAIEFIKKTDFINNIKIWILLMNELSNANYNLEDITNKKFFDMLYSKNSFKYSNEKTDALLKGYLFFHRKRELKFFKNEVIHKLTNKVILSTLFQMATNTNKHFENFHMLLNDDTRNKLFNECKEKDPHEYILYYITDALLNSQFDENKEGLLYNLIDKRSNENQHLLNEYLQQINPQWNKEKFKLDFTTIKVWNSAVNELKQLKKEAEQVKEVKDTFMERYDKVIIGAGFATGE